MDIFPRELWEQIHGHLEWGVAALGLAAADLACLPTRKRVALEPGVCFAGTCKHNTRKVQRVLGRAHTLELHCVHITAASELARVHTLNLANCVNLKTVAPLSRVHTLDLSRACDRIFDFSALAGVHTLNLSRTPSATATSPSWAASAGWP